MAVHTFNFNVTTPPVLGDSPLEQLVARMASHQSVNGGAAMYSFELPSGDSDWWFLGESIPVRPAGSSKINDLIDYWGQSSPIRDVDGVGRRAFESYNLGSNRQLLVGLGGPGQPSEWDAIQKQMWWAAGTTGNNDFSQGLVRYDMATDTFTHFEGPGDYESAEALWPGRGSAHNFGRSAYDPVRQVVYNTVGTHGDGRATIYRICYAKVGQANANPADRSWLGTFAESERYFSEWPTTRCDPNLGTEGSLIVIPFAGTANCEILRFDVATRTWSSAPYQSKFTSPKSGNDPDDLNIRFPATCFFDGYVYIASIEEDGRQKFWRIPTSLGPIDDSLPDCPVAMDAGGWSTGTQTVLLPMGRKIYAVHCDISWDIKVGRPPDYDGGIWAYDVDTQQWSAQLDTSWLQRLMQIETVINEQHHMTAAAVPELGVIIITTMASNFVTKSFVWKPAL